MRRRIARTLLSLLALFTLRTSSRSIAATVPRTRRSVAGSQVGRRKKADKRDLKERRIQLPRPVILNETAEFGIESVAADLRVKLVGDAPPAPRRSRIASSVRRHRRAIEGHPGHHLGMREVPPATAHFPNSLLGVTPDRLQVLEGDVAEIIGAFERRQAAARGLEQRVRDLTIYIELERCGRCIADAERARTIISWQPRISNSGRRLSPAMP